MSAPVKFLAVALAGWVTFRAAASALTFPVVGASAAPATAPHPAAAPSAATATAAAPVTYLPLGADAAATQPLPPDAYAQAAGTVPAGYPYPVPYGYAPPGYAMRAMRPVPMPMPVYYPEPVAAAAAMPLPRQTPWRAPSPGEAEPTAFAAADELPGSRPSRVEIDPNPGTSPGVVALDPPGPPRLDRWSLSSWSLLRQNKAAVLGTSPTAPALAIGGQLGGSQAGSRLTYRFTPRLSANLRFSAPIPTGRRSPGFNGEAALGVGWQPLAGLPLRLLAERRQRIGNDTGGRNAFALLAEGGIYGRPLPFGFLLDGYGQSGIVSARQRDWFVDGGLVAERPLFGRYSAGLGVWGGAQKGLNRLDVGPRVSARMTRNIRLSLDYRYRAFGNAEPGSGFAVTLGSDF